MPKTKKVPEELNDIEEDLGIDASILAGIQQSKTTSQSEKIARTLMIELIKSKEAAFIILRDPAINKWWTGLVAAEVKRQEDARRRALIASIKKQAYAKLSADELKALGLRKLSAKDLNDDDDI